MSDSETEYEYDSHCPYCNEDAVYTCCGHCPDCRSEYENNSECDSDEHYDIKYEYAYKDYMEPLLKHRDIIRKLKAEIEDLKSQLKSK